MAQGIKEIESSQRDRRNSLEKKIARLKDYLRINFEKTNTEKIESDDIVIAIYKNPAKVHIVDEEKIPEEFFQIKETKLLNKDKIKEVYNSFTSLSKSFSMSFASPKTIIELSYPNNSFCTPAKPGFILLLFIITVLDLSTFKIGIP